MNCNIIGAGRLGSSLAFALGSAKLVTVSGICNQTLESAQKVANTLGQGKAVLSLNELPPAEIIFITTPDDQLAYLSERLATCGALKKNTIIIHCSGVLSSSVLLPLRDRGCLTASCHPLKAFTKSTPDSKVFRGVDCVAEGDAGALEWLTRIFQALGAKVLTLPSENKALYHAAAVVASNYVITLADTATKLMTQAGIHQEQAYAMIGRLMQSNINNMQKTSCAKEALTGPLVRGDQQTIKKHLNAITDPLASNLYKAAGLATLPMTELSEEQKTALYSLFVNPR